jgi:hypothetical protein
VAMDCTCERWPMPCAHLAATIYVLAGSFDTDPFGAFAWRGRGRDELLMRLRQLRGAVAVEAPSAPPPETGLGDLAAFWGAPAPPLPPAPAAGRPDALLDQLDPPPLAVDGRPVIEILRPAYRAMPAGD